MDDNQFRDEFEEFLQEQTTNYRMYPSDSIWRNIDKELHGDKKWPALTIAAFVLIIATVGVSVYFSPKPNIFAVPQNTAQKEPFNSPVADKNDLASTSALLRNQNSVSVIAATPNKRTNPTNATPYIEETSKVPSNLALASLSIPAPEQLENIGLNRSHISPIGRIASSNTHEALAGVISNPPTVAIGTEGLALKKPEKLKPSSIGNKDYDDRNMVDEYLKQQKDALTLSTSLKRPVKQSRFSYQLSITPSVSYRKLKEDRSVNKLEGEATGPVALNFVTDVNQIVRHKPGTGMEAGLNIVYRTSKRVGVKAGVQFNMRQYTIEAYRSNTELATIALVTRSGIDTLSAYSTYRTTNGYRDQQLVNRYFQVAIPVGLEFELLGNKNIQLNVAATIQPTYLVNKDAYLLTTNLKNYTERSDMFKNWNLNTSFETFVSFNVGDFKWQLGPQVRYQNLSTFINQYPIKEHLLDYGLKLGFTKPLR